MSLPKKGSRKLSMGNDHYYWYIRKKPTYIQEIFLCKWTMVVELNGFNGAVLYISFNLSRPDNVSSPHQTSVTPVLVKRIIHYALQSGWQPKLPGSAFCLDYALIQDAVNPIN